MLNFLDKIFRRLDRVLEFLLSFIMIALILNVFYDVVSRYLTSSGSSVASQEFQWHLFGVMILFGMSYALRHEAHVRVDFIYNNLSSKTQAVINILGTLFFIIPFASFIVYGSIDFVMDSYTSNEISPDPGGLTHRWIIKSMIPISFLYLVFTSVGYIIHNIIIFKENMKLEKDIEI